MATEATGEAGRSACALSASEPEAARRAVVAKGEAAVGEGMVGLGLGGAADPALALGDVEEDDEGDILRKTRKGAGRGAATERHEGPGVEGAVIRAQVFEVAVRAHVSKSDVVRADCSEGAAVSVQVGEDAVVEGQDTEGTTIEVHITKGAERKIHVTRRCAGQRNWQVERQEWYNRQSKDRSGTRLCTGYYIQLIWSGHFGGYFLSFQGQKARLRQWEKVSTFTCCVKSVTA